MIAKVRANFKVSTVTGQLATADGPPLLTTPSRAKLGLPISADLVQAFQRCLVAPEGFKLLAIDYIGFHSLICGYLAGDPTYMRLARLGIHDYLAARMLRLDGCENWLALADDELRAKLKPIKALYPIVRNQAKEITHGSQFYEMPKAIAQKYHLIFNPSVGEAEQAWAIYSHVPPNARPYVEWWKRVTDGPTSKLGFQRRPWPDLAPEDQWTYVDWIGLERATAISALYHAAFPKIGEWQRRTLAEAEANHRLRAECEAQMWFWDVGGRSSATGEWIQGADLNNVISYRVQANAFAHIKEPMIELYEKGQDERYGLYLQLHDALHFCVRDELVDEATRIVADVMERPSRWLKGPLAPGGLVCRVEAKVGQNRADMEEVK